jgi:polyisoprenoid-binding protein YceI
VDFRDVLGVNCCMRKHLLSCLFEESSIAHDRRHQMATVAEKTAIPTGIWKSDPVHSSVGFSVKHMVVATFRGSFTDFDVTLDNSGGEPVIYGAVRVASVDVRDEKLSGHLLSPDFFDAERTPEIRFTSTDIRTEGDELVVDGELEIKGTSRPVEARGAIVGPIENIAGREGIGLELSTTVDRRDYGLNWNAELPKGGFAVENEVTLQVHLELAKEE